MSYTVINLTDSSRNNNPDHNDLMQYTYDSGKVIKKRHIVPPVLENEEEKQARDWRDMELKNTDFIVPTTDYPNHAAWLTYREQLRDWPSTDDFPETKPTKP